MVMFRWKEGVDDAHVEAIAVALGRLPGLIPEIVTYTVGRDHGLAATNFDFGVSGQFVSVDDFVRYRDHPEHQAVVQSLIAPFVSERCWLQFEES